MYTKLLWKLIPGKNPCRVIALKNIQNKNVVYMKETITCYRLQCHQESEDSADFKNKKEGAK